MSILSKLWRNIKGGRTDVQTVFSLFIDGLTLRQRNKLMQDLCAVAQAVEIASLVDPNSTQVLTAKDWVNGAMEALEATK